MTGTQIGTIIGVAFGFAWGIAGASAIAPPWRFVVIVASITISVFLVIASWRAPVVGSHFNGAVYGIAVALEVIAIVIASIFLNRSGNQTLVPPTVAAIVGLHFVGLWRSTDDRVFLYLAAALCGVGLIGALSPPSARLPVAGIGSAIALWASVAWTILR